MVPMVHSQDGHEGLTPRRREPQIMKQESLQPSAPQSKQTGRKLKPQRLTVINTSQRKLLERVPPWSRVSDAGVCVPLKGSPSPGPPGVLMVRRSEEWTQEQEAGATDPQGQGA